MLENKISTVVIHRNEKKLEQLTGILKGIPEFNLLGSSTSGEKGMKLILGEMPQFVFVCMHLDEMNGIDFVKELNKKYIYPEIAFISDDENLAYESMETHPLDYLVHPINSSDLVSMLERLKIRLRKKELKRKMNLFVHANSVDQKKVFKQKGGIVALNQDEILYCRAELTNASIVLVSDQIELVQTGLAETVEIINSPNVVKVSRSYYINRKYLRKIDKKRSRCILYFEGKSWEVPATRSAINQLEKLNTYSIY